MFGTRFLRLTVWGLGLQVPSSEVRRAYDLEVPRFRVSLGFIKVLVKDCKV